MAVVITLEHVVWEIAHLDVESSITLPQQDHWDRFLALKHLHVIEKLQISKTKVHTA